MYVLIVVGWMTGQIGEPSVAKHAFVTRETCEAVKRQLEENKAYQIEGICLPR